MGRASRSGAAGLAAAQPFCPLFICSPVYLPIFTGPLGRAAVVALLSLPFDSRAQHGRQISGKTKWDTCIFALSSPSFRAPGPLPLALPRCFGAGACVRRLCHRAGSQMRAIRLQRLETFPLLS